MAQQVGGGGVAAHGQARPARGVNTRAGAVGEQAVEAGDGGRPARPAARRRARARGLGRRVHAVGHQHQPRGPRASGEHRLQQHLGAGAVAGEQRARAEHLGGEPAEHLGEPVERVRVSRPVLGVAVQRQVGEHHAKAVGEPLDGGLPLLVGEHPRVQQRERRAGAELAVGDAGAVGVVVETQPHRSLSLTQATDAW